MQRTILMIGISFGLAACQSGSGAPPTLSLEEAKKVTTEFSAAFTPPPRTIADVTALLSEEKHEDEEAFKKAVAAVDAVPPATDDAKTLAQFYMDRGRAAFAAGRADQELADYRLAVKHGTGGREELRPQVVDFRQFVTASLYFVIAVFPPC